MRNVEKFAPEVLQTLEHMSTRVPPERFDQAVLAFSRAAVRIGEGINVPAAPQREQVSAIQATLELAAGLAGSGMRNADSVFLNGKNGLLDVFPATGQDSFERLDKAASAMQGILQQIPESERASLAGPLFMHAIDDARRLPPGFKESYLQYLDYDMKLTPEVRQRLARVAESGLSDSRLPLLAFMFDDPTNGALLRALDSDAVRSELRSNGNFRAVSDLIIRLEGSKVTRIHGTEEWVDLVRENLEHLASLPDGMSRRDKDAYRKEFVRDIVRHFVSMMDMASDGTMDPKIMRDMATKARGTHSLAELSRVLGEEYARILPPESGMTPEFAREHPKLVLDLADFRRDLPNYQTNGPARASKSLDFEGRQGAFDELPAVLDQAIAARTRGADAFRDFKYSKEFHDELAMRYGSDVGERIFQAWRQDARPSRDTTIGGLRYDISETGSFEDGLYGGDVKGEETCQKAKFRKFHIGGIVGTIELPWIKQVIIRAPESPDIIYRRRIFLMNRDDGKPLVLVQPKYGQRGVTAFAEMDDMVVQHLRERYPDAEVRVMDHAATVDVGSNVGYSTLESGRSPMFYIDSNAHALFMTRNDTQTMARNGLTTRERTPEGGWKPVVYGKGWSSERYANEIKSPSPETTTMEGRGQANRPVAQRAAGFPPGMRPNEAGAYTHAGLPKEWVFAPEEINIAESMVTLAIGQEPIVKVNPNVRAAARELGNNYHFQQADAENRLRIALVAQDNLSFLSLGDVTLGHDMAIHTRRIAAGNLERAIAEAPVISDSGGRFIEVPVKFDPSTGGITGFGSAGSGDGAIMRIDADAGRILDIRIAGAHIEPPALAAMRGQEVFRPGQRPQPGGSGGGTRRLAPDLSEQDEIRRRR